MTDKEIITALRKACQDCNPTPCCEYEVLGDEAANRIERLQSENEQLQLQLTAKETTLNGTYIDINTHYRDIEKLQSENALLRKQLDKAVEDLRTKADCTTCMHQANKPKFGSCSHCIIGYDGWRWRGMGN